MNICIFRIISLGGQGADVCPKRTEFHAGLQSAVLFRFGFFANCGHTKHWHSLRLIAFVRLPKTVPKSPFEPCLKHIVHNVRCFEPWTKTSWIKTLTSRKTLRKKTKLLCFEWSPPWHFKTACWHHFCLKLLSRDFCPTNYPNHLFHLAGHCACQSVKQDINMSVGHVK